MLLVLLPARRSMLGVVEDAQDLDVIGMHGIGEQIRQAGDHQLAHVVVGR